MQPRTPSLMFLWLCLIYTATSYAESTTFLHTSEALYESTPLSHHWGHRSAHLRQEARRKSSHLPPLTQNRRQSKSPGEELIQ